MTLRRNRANDDRLATVRGVHEGLPEHGVYDGSSVGRQRSRSRGCVAGSLSEGLRTLRRIEGQPDGWLKTVTRNLCLNHLSRYRARWRFFSEMAVDRDDEDASTPEWAAPDTHEQEVATGDHR